MYGYISTNNKDPNKYPTIPPRTDVNVVINAKFAQLYDLDITIGIKRISVGIGKKIDSMKLKKPKIFFDLKKSRVSLIVDIY
tara:strand:+ start:417 stop:662 length:246 start_codon:yes stop_codon:yes gene_type:complete